MAKWLLKQNKADIAKMAAALKVSQELAIILANRGFKTKEECENFLKSSEELFYCPNDYEMKDFRAGIDIMLLAVDNNEKILICGDYDADGITSTFIMYNTLKNLGADVDYIIPHRVNEGYGLNIGIAQKAINDGVNLMITCDNGVSTVYEIDLLKRYNIKVLVIDHHETSGELPNADAIINPKQKDCKYPFKDLCTAGIALKISMELYHQKDIVYDFCDEYVLAAIGTICDVVDMVSENRFIVKKGLSYIKNIKNIGLKSLFHVNGLLKDRVSAYDIGFKIGPNFNAPGRIESADMLVNLLIEHDKEKALFSAKEIFEVNETRKVMTQDAVKAAIEQVENNELYVNNIIFLTSDSIDESVAGIVAGRIRDAYYKPTIVATKNGNIYKASCRSVEQVDIYKVFSRQRHLLLKFGGHKMACGFSAYPDALMEFIKQVRYDLNNNYIIEEEIRIDAVCNFSQVTMELFKEFSLLEPHGKENPKPVFGKKSTMVTKVDFLGQEKAVLKFHVKEKGKSYYPIAFKQLRKFKALTIEKFGEEFYNELINTGKLNKSMDFLYTVDLNVYQDTTSIQFNIKDLRYS